jgi:CRISPR/Cas system CMR-associated protein Cmr1 (group 7 of RAMP superfamily)
MTLDKQSHTFELLTPAWTGGATPDSQAEIRVPTLRGHLRQWLRLLYPGQRMDEAIFGSIADGDAVRSSKVQLRLSSPLISTQAQDLAAYTGRNERDAVQHPEGYFLWPLRTQRRGVIQPGQNARFTLETRWYPIPSGREERQAQKKAFQHALTAFCILGTIGTRATRGYGSVWDTSYSFQSAEELSATLGFLPNNISVRLLDGGFNDGRAALAAAARWMRSFRIGSDNYGASTLEGRHDHDVADPAQAPQNNPQVFRQALGLPLTQRFRRDGQTSSVSSTHGRDRNDRYPSPLRIKVIRLSGTFRVLVVLLRDLCLPEGTPISLSNRRTATLSHRLLHLMAAQGTAIHPILP